MKTLVIAPHMDDEVLGMGGLIARHVSAGDDVCVCFIAHRVYAHRYDEVKNKVEVECALKAKELLGYREAEFFNLNDERLDACLQDVLIPLEEYVNKVRPEVVYLNHRGDNNQDHKAVFQAAMVALRPVETPYIKRILCYEVPSSTEQSPPFPEYVFLPNVYIDIKEFLDKKLAALRCYDRESRVYPHPRSVEAVETLARKRGSEAGFEAAEAFILLRERQP